MGVTGLISMMRRGTEGIHSSTCEDIQDEHGALPIFAGKEKRNGIRSTISTGSYDERQTRIRYSAAGGIIRSVLPHIPSVKEKML